MAARPGQPQVRDAQQAAPADEPERLRPQLLGLGYRLLGSMWDAENVVQEAYLRWTRADRSQVRDAHAFLITVVSRLARAVFILREAFDLPYDDIARILGKPAGTCRQLHRRAALRMADRQGRFEPSPAQHRALLERFLHAARSGDLVALGELLSEDVVAYNDGGGKVRAALRPVTGRAKVLHFVAGLMSRYPIGAAGLVTANGEPAIWTVLGEQRQLITVDLRDGRIHAIYAVLNPDKLRHLPQWPQTPAEYR